MKTGMTVAALLLTGLLTACGGGGDTKKADADAPAMDAGMAADMMAKKSGSGTGRVMEIDAAAGSITLDHDPIPAMDWPGMTMAFESDPAMLEGLQPGDPVAFDVTADHGRFTITGIRKENQNEKG